MERLEWGNTDTFWGLSLKLILKEPKWVKLCISTSSLLSIHCLNQQISFFFTWQTSFVNSVLLILLFSMSAWLKDVDWNLKRAKKGKIISSERIAIQRTSDLTSQRRTEGLVLIQNEHFYITFWLFLLCLNFKHHNHINRTTEKKTQQKKDALMEVSATVLQQESSESMDFSLTPEPVETEPMQAANVKPRYSYKWVDSWSWIHINTRLSFITL